MQNGKFTATPEKYENEVGEFNEKQIFGQKLKEFSFYV